MSLVFVNTFFDFKDFESPVKKFIDDSIYFELDPTEQKLGNIYLSVDEVELEDDYF